MTKKSERVAEFSKKHKSFTKAKDIVKKESQELPTLDFVGKLRKRFAYLDGNWARVFMWPVVSLTAAAGIWYSVNATIVSDKEAAELRAMQEAAILSDAYAEQIRNTLSGFDNLLSTIKYLFAYTPNAYDFIQYVRDGIYSIENGVNISVINAQGQVINTSKKVHSSADVSQTPFFLEAIEAKEDKIFVHVGSTPLLRSPVVRFSRRLNDDSGNFKGLAVVSVSPTYLASFYDPTRITRVEYQSLVDLNGMVVAAISDDGNMPSQEFKGRPPPLTQSSGVRRFPAEQSPDGRSRIVAWQSLDDFPLMTTVGMNDDIVFASVDDSANELKKMAASGTALFFLFALLGMESTVRRARHIYRKEQSEKAYRLANEGALEGFYTIEPIRDRSGNIVDFVTIDCNERGANLAGMTASDLIGRNLSDVYSGTARENLIEYMRTVMQSGYLEGEVEPSSEGPFLAQWLHYRFVRQGDCIAVTVRDISDAKRLQAELWQTLHFDVLTGLPNRNWLLKHFPSHFEKSKTTNQQIAVLYLDLDNFKAVNSTLGHLAGDQILRSVGQRLQALLRPGDHIVRIGGDEFAVLIYDVESEDVQIVSQRLMEGMNEPFRLQNGIPYRLSLSIGISRYPQHGNDIETLLRNADVAMYASKASGKARYQFFEASLMQNVVARADCENLLRMAIEHDQFVMHYQPRVDVMSGAIVSLEGLVRILHPTRGLIHPTDFISVAEDTGLIIQIGETVIRKACEQINDWREQGIALVPISVNVSAAQFAYGRVKACVCENLQKFNVDPALLELELTESCMMGDKHHVSQELALLQEMGIKLLLDDFGTGYSSLSQLQTLNLDVLKIDRSFTEQLLNGENAEIFFQAMMTMAKSLNMRVVAEGVESVEQLHILKRLNCIEIQGFLVSRPVDALEMTSLLQKRYLLPRQLQRVPNTR